MKWYDKYAIDSFQQEEVKLVDDIFTFALSVAAGVVSYYICKWLDREE